GGDGKASQNPRLAYRRLGHTVQRLQCEIEARAVHADISIEIDWLRRPDHPAKRQEMLPRDVEYLRTRGQGFWRAAGVRRGVHAGSGRLAEVDIREPDVAGLELPL